MQKIMIHRCKSVSWRKLAMTFTLFSAVSTVTILAIVCFNLGTLCTSKSPQPHHSGDRGFLPNAITGLQALYRDHKLLSELAVKIQDSNENHVTYEPGFSPESTVVTHRQGDNDSGNGEMEETVSNSKTVSFFGGYGSDTSDVVDKGERLTSSTDVHGNSVTTGRNVTEQERGKEDTERNTDMKGKYRVLRPLKGSEPFLAMSRVSGALSWRDLKWTDGQAEPVYVDSFVSALSLQKSLVETAYKRSKTAGHSKDFVGHLPLFPPCAPDIPPGVATWGKFPYIKQPWYIPESKNPCWFGNDDDGNDKCDNDELCCLPYFFLVGVSKSGTSDLYFRLTGHPNVVATRKEHHFFDWHRYSEPEDALSLYLKEFQRLGRKVRGMLNITGASDLIGGDATPSYFFHNGNWPSLSGNEGCQEPRVLSAHHIMHWNPQAKVILIFRNPVDRLYSRYLFYCTTRKNCSKGGHLSNVVFHNTVVDGLAKYRDCFVRWSLRHCAYNISLARSVSPTLRLQENMYSVILEDWLRIVPRQQLLVICFEHYVTRLRWNLERVFRFLELGTLENLYMQKLVYKKPVNKGKGYRRSGDILPKTRAILRAFYLPFMQQFERLLRTHRLMEQMPSRWWI